MKKHFVTFLSPGTFVAEQTTKEIDAWDVDQAIEMSRSISERYGAKPYGFYFTTRSRADDELDSRVTERSGTYYLGGKIETIDDVRARNDPSERILLSNMECNGWNRIIVNTNSWKVTQPFGDGDTLLEFEPA